MFTREQIDELLSQAAERLHAGNGVNEHWIATAYLRALLADHDQLRGFWRRSVMWNEIQVSASSLSAALAQQRQSPNPDARGALS